MPDVELVTLGSPVAEALHEGETTPTVGQLAVWEGAEGDLRLAGIDTVASASSTFETWASGSASWLGTAADTAALKAAKSADIDTGVVQIDWSGANASLLRTVSLTSGAPAADLQFATLDLADLQKNMVGETFTVRLTNTDGGAVTITFGSDTGYQAVVETATIPAMPTAAGSRVTLVFFVDPDDGVTFTGSFVKDAA